jgi:6-phosphogluconolactonase (cycloisomerase 2 family)
MMMMRLLGPVMLGLLSAQDGESRILYVQSGQGLKWFSVSPAGAVTPKGSLATSKISPCYLRVSPDRKVLYAAGVPDRLLVLSIGSDGSLTPSGEAPSPGGPCYVDVHPSGRWVATANYGPGKTLLYPVGADGTVGEAVTHSTGAQTHSVRFDPAGKFLYSLSVGDRKITRIAVEGGGATSTLSMGDLGPRHLAFSPGGKFAYVVNERPIKVSSVRLAETLELVGTWPALEAGVAEKQGLAAAEIAVTPSGKFVVASVRDFSKEGGLNGLAVYSADPETGALRWVEFVPSGGVSPRGFVIDPSGTLLFVLNEIPGTLRTFRIDSESGRLTSLGEAVPVGGPAIGIAWLRLP